MKIFKISLFVVFISLVVIYTIRLFDKTERSIVQEEKIFKKAAQELIAKLENGDVVRLNKTAKDNFQLQEERLLISSFKNKKGAFYSFRILKQFTPMGVHWVVLPGFYDGHFEDSYTYHIEIYEEEVFDPNLFSHTYYSGYKQEPFYSTFQLLQTLINKHY